MHILGAGLAREELGLGELGLGEVWPRRSLALAALSCHRRTRGARPRLKFKAHIGVGVIFTHLTPWLPSFQSFLQLSLEISNRLPGHQT